MLKVIIVEDEDIIRKGLVFTIDWFSMDCIIVAEAGNGEDGLEKILELKPDVVITDIKMPKMNGFEMVRQSQKLVDYKCIFLTSYAEFDYAQQAIELKAYNYLVKPVDEGKIISLMKSIHEELSTKKEEMIEEINHNPSIKIDLGAYINLDRSTSRYVAKAIQIIQNRYDKKISVEDVAEELGVSTSYLSRKIKDVTKHSFLDLLNGYRVQQAIRLLNKGDYRISEISDMTGFSDYKYFCTVFKRYTLMSPTGYAKKTAK